MRYRIPKAILTALVSLTAGACAAPHLDAPPGTDHLPSGSDPLYPDAGRQTTEPDTSDTVETESASDSDESCARFTSMSVPPLLPHVMLLLDRSSAMNDRVDGDPTKWELATQTAEAVVAAHSADAALGLDMYPGTDNDNETCAASRRALQDTVAGNDDAVLAALEGVRPGGEAPLLEALANFTTRDHAPEFLGRDNLGILVIVAGGGDTCGADPGELAAATEQILSEYGIVVVVVGIGDAIENEHLAAVAASGGTQFTAPVPVDEIDLLTAYLTSSIGDVIACTLDTASFVDDPDTVDFDKTVVTLDGEGVPQVSDCSEDNGGWRWTDASHDGIEFCAETCELLVWPTVQTVEITIGCR